MTENHEHAGIATLAELCLKIADRLPIHEAMILRFRDVYNPGHTLPKRIEALESLK
jgi:hypothetical protein